MSRLIVKGLPAHCTEANLRFFFEKYGALNDCTLKYTKEGKFRKFAFVGFDSDEIANTAMKETHQAYMGSSKLQVEVCKPFGDSEKPRAWSQYSKDSSAYKRRHGVITETTDKKGKDVAQPDGKKEVDPEFQKFLQSKGVEHIEDKTSIKDTGTITDNELIRELRDGLSGDTKLSLIFTGLPSSIKPKNLKEWLSPVRVKALKIARNDSFAAALVSFNRPPDIRRVLQRDQQFIGGYKVTIRKVEEDQPEYTENADDEEQIRFKETEEVRIREEILETGRLFVRNLPFRIVEEDLYFLFKKYGEIADVQVIIDKKTGACKGFAIVEFVFPESAVAAFADLDGKIFKGRILHIIAGAERREINTDENTTSKNDNQTSSYKKEKQAKLKASAHKSHSWNSLFLGPNAVAETLAEKLGVGKADILTAEEGESAGVRLALAETRLVRETRDFLLANGVMLDAFSRPAAKRSNTVILAKNLPAGVLEEELRRMFQKFGAVDKVLIPPECAISALIVMGNAVDAKRAFQGLAYSRFRTQPLYLEWAPGDIFGEIKEDKVENGEIISDSIMTTQDSGKETRSKRKAAYEEKIEKKKAKVDGDDCNKNEFKEELQVEENCQDLELMKNPIDEEIEQNTTVFVKNLSFTTTDDSLDKIFRKNYRIISAQISKKLNPTEPSKSLSMGFGFVQFFTQDEAKKAVKEMQGKLLDGHCLELKMSHREVINRDEIKRKALATTEQGKCTKLLIRNLPFQAKIKEIESLFATFGEIKNIRIPKKMGSKDQHRGFGFIDFMSISEAKRAFEALVHSTHLYGRRLVLEWAKEEDSIEELREKTAEKFCDDKKVMKKQKQQIEAIEKDLATIIDD